MTALVSVSTLPAGIGRRPRFVALCGNPNVGKSSLFNALTGMRQKVGNYPGITVERRAGVLKTPAGPITIIDLPGSYSLLPRSPDERVARDEILGRMEGDPPPDVVVVVADAGHVARSLFLISQVIETGRPVVVALNQIDGALSEGITVDPVVLEAELGVPVIPTCGRSGAGTAELGAAILKGGRRGKPAPLDFPSVVCEAADGLAGRASTWFGGVERARAGLLQVLTSEAAYLDFAEILEADDGTDSADVLVSIRTARAELETAGVDVATTLAQLRYRCADAVAARSVTRSDKRAKWQRRIDSVLTHPLWGSIVLAAAFFLIFEMLFSWSGEAIDLVDVAISSVGELLAGLIGPGLLADFVQNGVVGGFAAFLVFVPQILLLFLCIEALEDSGYLARAAFLLDKVMGKAGLPGRAFLPLLSGFACAIPGIMAARTIENRTDRFVTMAVLPLMSCSARLPVYVVITGALFTPFGGTVVSLVIMSMYLFGVLVAFAGAKLLRKMVLTGPRSPLLLELPPYRRPSVRSVFRHAGHRTWSFVWGAGPIILTLSMALWGLASFPRNVDFSRDYAGEITGLEDRLATLPAESAAAAVVIAERGRLAGLESAERLEKSYMGRAAKWVEPAFEPLGFDWKMDVAILASFAAREVFVPTLGVIYSVGEAEAEDVGLLENIRRDRYPDGRAVFTPLVGISLLVFYVIAMQCMSTLAVIKRETNSWRWPIGVFVVLTAAAYLASLLVYQVGTLLGF